MEINSHKSAALTVAALLIYDRQAWASQEPGRSSSVKDTGP